MVNFTNNFGKISAISAKSFKIVFNEAPADITKVAISVKRSSLAVNLTPTWNDAKTELTLASDNKLVQDDYSINVKYDTTDLGTSQVKIEQEKVAKIEFLSDTAIRSNDWEARIPVKVSNQYGEDITTSPLTSNIQWTSSVDACSKDMKSTSVYIRKGTVNTYSVADLKYLPAVVVSAFDNTSGTFASATLKVSATIGGIAEIKFGDLVDASGKPATLVAGSVQKYYLNYDAKDSFGNTVNDYATLHNTDIIRFNSSYPTAANISVEQDPADSTKALLVVTAGTSANVPIDMPVTFTAIALTSGKNAVYTTTVKKAAAVATFNLMMPDKQVAAGETVILPYVAFDQDGNQITSYSQLQGKINYSGVTINESSSSDGKYVIKATFAAATKYLVTATVPGSGKISTIQLDVKSAATPSALAAVSTSYPAMVSGATQFFDFYNYGNLSVNDNYDRSFDMLSDTNTYEVLASSDNPAIVAVSGVANDLTTATANPIAKNDNAIKVTAGSTPGTTNVHFYLFNDADKDNTIDNGELIDEKTLSLSTVEKKDIVDYGIGSVAKLYDLHQSTYYDGTDAGKNMYESITPYGLLAGGTKVKLASTDTVLRSTDDSRFVISGTKVYAYNLGNGITDATAKVYASVLGNGNIISTPSTTVTASSVAPKATDIYAYADYLNADCTGTNKCTMVGDTIDISAADFTALMAKGIYKYSHLGVATDWAGTNSYFYIEVADSYGNTSLIPAMTLITQTKDATASTPTTITLDTDGKIANTPTNNVEAGDEFLLTAMTSNGLTATYKIIIK